MYYQNIIAIDRIREFFYETTTLYISLICFRKNKTRNNYFISDRQIGATVKYKLIDLYKEFQNDIIKKCNFTPGLGRYPVDLNGIYGELDEPYTIFMTPGTVLT